MGAWGDGGLGAFTIEFHLTVPHDGGDCLTDLRDRILLSACLVGLKGRCWQESPANTGDGSCWHTSRAHSTVGSSLARPAAASSRRMHVKRRIETHSGACSSEDELLSECREKSGMSEVVAGSLSTSIRRFRPLEVY